jgi:FkbM family methyltransferase
MSDQAALDTIPALSEMLENVMEVHLQGRRLSVVKKVGDANFEPFWTYFSHGLWEIDTLEMISSISSEDTIFLDIGGWIGPTALWAAFKQSTVIAFEPDPIALKALRLNLELNPVLKDRIKIVPAAVARCGGDLDLFAARPGLSETSVFSKVDRSDGTKIFGNKITVPTIDLAQFIRDLSPHENKIFIKMDIEGAEFHVLPHIADIIQKYDVFLSATLHPHNIVENTPDETMAARLLRMAKCLEPFSSLKWFKFENGAYQEVQKFHFLVETLNRLNQESHFIVAKSAP